MLSFENSVRLAAAEGGTILVGGDFNCRSRQWWDGDVNTTEGDRLYQVSVNSSLTQLIHEPTRLTASSKSCIDLIFCNKPGFLASTGVTTPIDGSDHSCITATLKSIIDIRQSPKIKRVWYYEQANIQGLNNDIRNHNWFSTRMICTGL